MVRLSWGNVLAIILPGAVGLVGLQYQVALVSDLLSNLGHLTLSGGFSLLLMAAILGGVIDGIRRLLVDEGMLSRFNTVRNNLPPAEDSFFYCLDEKWLPVFNTGIDESYRYFCFYSNLSIAILLWVGSRLLVYPVGKADAALIIVALILAGAGYVQYSYFRYFLAAFEARSRQELGGTSDVE